MNLNNSLIQIDSNGIDKAKEEQDFKEFNSNLNSNSKDLLIKFYEEIMQDFASYKDQADIYINFIKQIDKDNICQIILHVYTIKGFINQRIRFMLCEKFTDKSYLIGFLVILMGVMKCDGINNFFSFFYLKNLVFEESSYKKKFIRLYKEFDCNFPTLVKFYGKLDKEKSEFFEKMSIYL
jgi:hypothetical protein